MNIFDEVKKDFEKRNALGWELYKKELMPDDDVDWLLNAYEEALDLCVYLKGQLLSRDFQKTSTVTRSTSTLRTNGQGQDQVSAIPSVSEGKAKSPTLQTQTRSTRTT